MDEFRQNLRKGSFKNIIVFSGAGISTSSGLEDFRSVNGMFNRIKTIFGVRFPKTSSNPTLVFSRLFARTHPNIYKTEVLPLLTDMCQKGKPTHAHRFCGWLNEQGWLKRVYTQNIDMLHSVHLPRSKVVEFHGSFKTDIVLYGDAIPPRVLEQCQDDLFQDVDLVLVLGTSLQVAPFCALPNMVPTLCTRVLVNFPISDCITNLWTKTKKEPSFYGECGNSRSWIKIGKRRVTLRPQWKNRKRKWPQLLLEMSCDSFAKEMMTNK
jgi:NAD-dependent SIR2 family protein deacetylase